MVDQSFGMEEPRQYSGLYYPIYSDQDWAQTLTVGISGALTGVALRVHSCCEAYSPNPLPYPLEPFAIQIVETVDGLPSLEASAVLATQLVSQAAIDAALAEPPEQAPYYEYPVVMIDLDVHPQVQAGQLLAIVIERYPLPGFEVLNGAYNPYTAAGYTPPGNPTYALPTYLGGNSFYRRTGDWLSTSEYPGEEDDLLFATYVDPEQVPEPGAFLAVGLSLALLLLRRG